MSKRDAAETSPEKSGTPAMLIEVQVQQAHLNCPLYSWDREAACLRVTGIEQAARGLPADLATLQLEGQVRYSLLGSSLSIFVPQADGVTQQSIPFHSPAIAWFVPLFTRLRLLLSGPYVR